LFSLCEWVSVIMVWLGSFAGLVIAASGEFGGVAGPVSAGLVHPAHCGGRVQVEQVGERGGG
jgi:hypothetical protein